MSESRFVIENKRAVISVSIQETIVDGWIGTERFPSELHGVDLFLEMNSCSVTHEIPRILWNLEVLYHVHKSLPAVHVLSQMSLLHTLLSYVYKIHFNLILPSLSRYS
jgi:hypothetical protein